MDGIIDENELTVIKEFEFDKIDINEIDYILDDVIKDCRNKYFHTFKYKLVYDLKFIKISNHEEVNFLITHKSLEFKTEIYGLSKKIKNARENGFIFNQINKLTINIYSNLKYINIHHHLKIGAPILHRQFFIKISKNRDYIQTHCNDLNNPFHFACHRWYSYNNPSILT